jgi:Ran GTPase-activating protein 1
MSASVFSIHGQGLHLNTAADIEPHLRDLRAVSETVQEIHFGGNTFGINASLALAEVLKDLKALKVCSSYRNHSVCNTR